MRRERLHLSQYQSIETYRDWNGRVYLASSSGCSMLFRDVKLLRKWLQLPPGIPSRAAFDSWVESVLADDAERAARNAQSKEGLSDEYLATGFGPEAHRLDESDPQHQTRTII